MSFAEGFGKSASMPQIALREDCTGCGCCAAVCPVSCITMEDDVEGFSYPTVEVARCISCGRCAKACLANDREDQSGTSSFYVAQHHDSEVLSRCSSGGVFDALAKTVLSRGGVVFGAARDWSTGRVAHTIAVDSEGLAPMRLSKYDQSKAWGSYPSVSAYLAEGVPVLFTGTPCQVAALRSYLGHAYNNPNLVTMEVLCHGVTSNRVVASYLDAKADAVDGEIVDVKFRTKEGPWGWEDSSHAVFVVSNGGGTKLVRDKIDSFMFGYIRSLYLRESCYRCRYCSTTRTADFMAGDYWGITEREMPKVRRRRGVSLLAVTGPRAEKLLRDIEGDLCLEPLSQENAVRRNGALLRPARRPAFRDMAVTHLGSGDFEGILLKEFRMGILKRNIKSFVGPGVSKALRMASRAISHLLAGRRVS